MSFIHQLQNLSGSAPLNRRRALLGLSLLALTACSRLARENKTSDNKTGFYTCTMHPFVHSQDPKGKCPVCGMDLVSVNSTEENRMVYIAPERLQEIGATTEVVAKAKQVKSGLTVSVAAVMPTGNKFIVFVDHGGGYLEPREIEVGVQSGDNYEVISGLNEGDRVFCSANFLIDAESRIQGVLKTWGDRP